MTKPWSFKEGVILGCGLLGASLIAQYSIGAINWSLTAWPINIILLILLALIIITMHLLRKKVHLFAWLSTGTCAICALAFALLVTLALGLIEQTPSWDLEAFWAHRLLNSWPFVITYIWLTLSLGMTIMRVGAMPWTWRTVAFMFNHLGFFIVLVTASLGNADVHHLNMIVGKQEMGYEPQTIAYNYLSPMHEPVKMDFSLTLNDFTIEYYNADSLRNDYFMLRPKRYTSHVSVYENIGNDIRLWGDTIIEVNKPININGWKVYQYGYDSSMGTHTSYSEFQLVRDPWLPWVYTGIFLMLAGAFTLFFTSPLSNSSKNQSSDI